MKNNLRKLYDIITLKREIRQLKKQIKEQQKQIDVMIKNAKERELNLKFATERANKFQTELRKLKRDGCKREEKIKKTKKRSI